jgi:hypothetical protein
LICYDVDFLLPNYYVESNEQFVFIELDKTTKRILTTDLSDMENRSVIMRSFKGNIAGLVVPYKSLLTNEFSGSEIEYRVLVSDLCYLMSSSSKQNDIIFIEGARDRDGKVTTLRIRKMAEGRPIDR